MHPRTISMPVSHFVILLDHVLIDKYFSVNHVMWAWLAELDGGGHRGYCLP